MEQAAAIEPIAGVGSIFAADRVFGLLEREFPVADIVRATGAALKPAPDVDLSAHRTLLKLSRDPSGHVRLVTTNFDRLFEQASRSKLTVFTPNRLPEFRGGDMFSGIVHLHGILDPSYSKSAGGDLVLSSAEFGRAYLSEGWATQFIQATIKHYLIVFIGYAADDPPVQYLLEALNRAADGLPRHLYAFQGGADDEAKALWAHKGVRAIAYSSDAGHKALWESLDAWADRASNQERWRDKLLRRALRGPEKMQPHERGQVVHLASTDDGARSIANAKVPLPGTWLCVFDPWTRYAAPRHANIASDDSRLLDPFNFFGLDSDPPPPPEDDNLPIPRRKIPPGAINVFAPSGSDASVLPAAFRGAADDHVSSLPPRLGSLTVWLARICGDPSALWWAAGQPGLHPEVIRQITFWLDHKLPDLPGEARAAWQYLFESWKWPRPGDYSGEFALGGQLSKDGWTGSIRRRYLEFSRAKVKASRPILGSSIPNTGQRWPRHRSAIISLTVEYPERRHAKFEIPDDQLVGMIPLLRQNLEHAVNLERELRSAFLPNIAPIEADPNVPGQSSEREFGINVLVSEFVALFRRLLAIDKQAALDEFAAWRGKDDPVSGRLKIWATGLDGLLADVAAADEFTSSHDAIFWGSRDARDVLISLSKRWNGLPAANRAEIERRLLAGPPRRRDLSANTNLTWKAHEVLQRVTWLRSRACQFHDDADAKLKRFQELVPEWTPDQASSAADSIEGRGGFVRTDTSIDELRDVPIAELIPRAMAGRRHVWGQLVEIDPFAGLCEKRPVRLLAALKHQLRQGIDVTAAWEKFLYSSPRRNDKPKLAAVIARRLAALPQNVLSAIIMPASYWIEALSKTLFDYDRKAFEALFARLVDSLATGTVAVDQRPTGPARTRNWAEDAGNSAAGRIAAALFEDPLFKDVDEGKPIPPDWLSKAERLLAMPDDHGRFALVVLARSLSLLYHYAPAWADRHIISAVLEDGGRRDAALAGYLLNPLYLDAGAYQQLKTVLVETAIAGAGSSPRREVQALGAFFAGGWLYKDSSGARLLTDDEFRHVLLHGGNDLRLTALWQVNQFPHAEKIAFINNVWPLQLAARTPVVVERLCWMAFEDDVNFPELVASIIPIVSNTRAGFGNLMLGGGDKVAKIAQKFPGETLSLLSALLTDDVDKWPIGLEKTLDIMVEAQPALASDSRFLKLKNLMRR